MNTGLLDLAPWSVFFCDYLAREDVAAGRNKASAELASREGGPLGVVELEELVLGARDVENARRHWRALLDSPGQEAGDVFSFGEGPRLRLVPASRDSIQRQRDLDHRHLPFPQVEQGTQLHRAVLLASAGARTAA